MITLSRLNGASFAVNCDLIERIDASPDTVLTLVDGTRYVVAESLDEVIDRVRAFRAEGDQVIASERRLGAVARQLLLGDTLDGDSVRADYTDGVLTLTIAAAEAAKPRKVEVSTGASSAAIEASASEPEGAAEAA